MSFTDIELCSTKKDRRNMASNLQLRWIRETGGQVCTKKPGFFVDSKWRAGDFDGGSAEDCWYPRCCRGNYESMFM